MEEQPDPPKQGLPRNREEIARFVMERKERIQAIARRRLAPGARGPFDSEDVIASVIRRIDQMASRGVLRIRSEGELWALISTIAANNAIGKSRIVARSHALFREDREFARFLIERTSGCHNDEEAEAAILGVVTSIGDPTMRQVFLLRLRGATHESAAGAIGMSPAAFRQRWRGLMRSLVERFAGRGGDL